MKNEWSNVSGELAIELYGNPTVNLLAFEQLETIFDASDDKAIPAITPDMVPDIRTCHGYDLVIDFVSSGYYDSGRTSGLPENCYPPEGEEDREPVRAYLIRYERCGPVTLEMANIVKTEIELSTEKMNELFNHFEKQINEVELEDSMM